MGMRAATLIGPESRTGNPRRESERNQHDSGPPENCCGKPMERRFARAHDRLGQTLFVAVWHCPICERVVF